ncbi:MAG: 2'-5' RNA ligase family protein [Bacteroidales bacterium]|nr:2'-5' RNA ligase family protein [Bacteroidales bacterium]
MKTNTKTYLELEIPLEGRSSLLSSLKESFRGIPVRWQKGFWHVTIVFMDSTPDIAKASGIISRHLGSFSPVQISIDQLEAFTTSSGKGHVIALSTKAVPQEISTLAENLRKDFSRIGCTIRSRFFFHITLGRVDAEDAGLAELGAALMEVNYKGFIVTASKFNYRIFRGELIRSWNLSLR